MSVCEEQSRMDAILTVHFVTEERAVASDAKLTNSTEEYTLYRIFTERAQFGIPYFQRPYKWKNANIERFENDLISVVDIEGESHFLGAIIMFERYTSIGLPTSYQIIDGQQRITTCFLALAALAKTYLDHGFDADAANLYNSSLIIPALQAGIPNSKLISCKDDRASLNAVFDDLNSVSLTHIVGNNVFRKLGSSTEKSGQVWKNYVALHRFFSRLFDEQEKQEEGGGKRMIDSLYAGLMNHMTVVWIVVKDPTDGPKIFNSLNSKQEPMTIGDLVRNEVFSKISSEDDSVVEMTDVNYWRPFYRKFIQGDAVRGDRVFEQYFFPFALTLKSSVKKDGAFNYLRDRWAQEDDPTIIIAELSEYQDIYLDLCTGTQYTTGASASVSALLGNLYRMKAPNSIYPFVFHVVKAAQRSEIDMGVAEDMLQTVESFLVRRSVCGYEPTGLHAVFKSLWSDCGEEHTTERMSQEIRKHATVAWPGDDEFGAAIVSRPLYRAKITSYLLEEWNTHLGGDRVSVDGKQVEHVLPVKPKSGSQWHEDWAEDQQKEKRDCLANLLPISQSLNSSIQNAEYAVKRDRYLQDSALKAAREFAQTYDTWTPTSFDTRAATLKTWALNRWDR